MDPEDDKPQQVHSSGLSLRRLEGQELQGILECHQQWLDACGEGRPAAEGPADLSRTDLTSLNLNGCDLRGANLQAADLSGTNLLNAKLHEADLGEANLEEANHLLAKQLAGADLAGTRLPEAMLRFEGLEIVEQISRNARTIMFSMLLACVYTWLTIATTTDPLLLTNSISSPLPIIRTEIPIAGFFWAAPLILLSLYFYFHIYLQRLWETLADLPAVFPDGSRLDKRAYPWLLNGLVTSHFKRLRNSRPRFSRLQSGLSILLGWWTVPLTLLALWLRYLPRHDWFGTTLHVALSLVAIVGGILFYLAATATLRLELKPSFSWKRYMTDASGVKRTALVLVMAVVLFGLSFGAIHGIPHDTKHAADLPAIDLRLWVPRVMEALGNSTFADFIEESISTKPANWVENDNDKSNLDLIKGARLKRANLAHANARSAFLVKADLRQAFLYGADLRNSDLRRANLQNANLNFASLGGARLEGVSLKGARLHGVNLDGYYFIRANLQGIDFSDADLRNIEFVDANLQEANLVGARLQKIDLGGANLAKADLSGARLRDVSLEGVNFEEARLMDIQGLTRNDLWQTANWLFAHFDNKTLNDFDLPRDLQARAKKKNFSQMSLNDIYFLKIDLRKFDFHESSLQKAQLSRVDLTGADLSQANLKNAKMRGNLRQANLSGADLRKAEIRYSNLYQANLQKANLKGALLVEADLRLANLAQADLSRVTFGNWAKMEGANLKGADISGSHLRNARGLTCQQLQEAILDQKTELPGYLDSCPR